MMAEEFLRFGSPPYNFLLGVLLFARGTDFVSTWVATPNLLLEANPIARKLGWRLGLLTNIGMCFAFALWPLPAIVVVTTSLLVAARNFQSAWLMRSMGEQSYRYWMSERMSSASRRLFFFCLFAQTALVGILGAGLMYFSRFHLVPFGVGMGLVTYGLAILFYSTLSVWRTTARPL